MNKIHKQWFNQTVEKKEKFQKHQPVIIKRVQDDYNKLEDLASERISLAEEALKLVKKLLLCEREREREGQFTHFIHL